MTFAICHLSVVPVRNSSHDRSEQVTQLLFGEVVEILDKKGKSWAKVRCSWDNYIGWVDTRQIRPITKSECESYLQNFAYVLDLLSPVMSPKHHLPVTIGARLPNFDGMRLHLENTSYTFSGQAVFPADIRPNADLILKLARRYLFAPHQWGGRSPLGIDAAGLTQLVFQIIGVQLHREAEEQVHQGITVDFVEQSQPGDLAFFENKAGNINHVGIIMPERQIIHAAGCVRIDTIDHFGIFNEETGKYTHRLRIAKRMTELPDIAKKEKSMQAEKNPRQVALF